jgi:transglutaminase-like putative cysteine protease
LFGLFVLTGTFSLALFHLKSELFRRETTGPLWTIPFDRRYMVVLASMSVVIFATSLGIFFGFPRIGLGYFAQNSRSGVNVGGFSDSVQLGSHGTIQDNPTVVMRVEFPDGKPSNFRSLHWRTITFDKYTDNGWSRTMKYSERPLRSRDGVYTFNHRFADKLEESEPRQPPRRMDIYLEPLDRDLLPTVWPTKSLSFQLSHQKALPGSPRSGSVESDAYGDLEHTVPSDIGVPYSIELLRQPSERQLRAVDQNVDAEGRKLTEKFLQLPGGMQRVEQLARRVTEDAETPYAKAKALERHLQTNYTYTTDLPKVDPDRPIEDFLFEARRGHCEYYATTMTLMLRMLGIPARMVNGFLGGKWNGVGDYLTVRQGDAHSWVELYIKGYGWVPLDPTPAGGDDLPPGLTDWLTNSYDAMRMAWMQWVIEYDLDTQVDMLRDLARAVDGPSWLADSGGSSREQQQEDDGEGIAWRPIFLWGGLGLVCLGGGLRSRRLDARLQTLRLAGHGALWSGLGAGWASLFYGLGAESASVGLLAGVSGVAAGTVASYFDNADTPPVTRLFERIEHAAERAGVARRDDEPAAAFLKRLADEYPDLSRQLNLLRHRYMESRFGGRQLDDDIRRELNRMTKKIVKHLRSNGDM